MPLNGKTTTVNFFDTVLVKPNATSFTVDVSNQYALYQLNAAPLGRGENWVPAEGIDIGPGYWTFGPEDWASYGVPVVQGIRFKSKIVASPSVISVS